MSKELIKSLRSATPIYHPGWGGPQFTTWMDEQMSWKTTCYIGDWSFLPDITIEGPDSIKLFSDTSVNSFARFDIGQAKHAIQCNEAGKVITEGIIIRVAEEKFIVQSAPVVYFMYMISKGGYDCKFHPNDRFKYQVQGPNSLALLEKLSGQSLRDIRFMHYDMIKIKGHDVMTLRQGMAGEVGFELQGPMAEYGKEVYDAVVEAGQDLGIRRLGHRTAMINHLEASFPTGHWHYLMDLFSPDFSKWKIDTLGGSGLPPVIRGSFEGEDVTDYMVSPIEAGWGKNVKFDHEFVGRKALEIEMANPKRNIVTLEFNSHDMIDVYASLFGDAEPYEPLDLPHQEMWTMWADKVMKDGKLIGVSSVPGYSVFFRKVISLAYLDVACTTPGTEVTVVWGNPGKPQKDIRATVAPAPYKKDNRRIDLTKI